MADIAEDLIRNGFNYQGKDMFYSGLTGELVVGYIYAGPVSFRPILFIMLIIPLFEAFYFCF